MRFGDAYIAYLRFETGKQGDENDRQKRYRGLYAPRRPTLRGMWCKRLA